MILTTTSTIEGRKIVEYQGVVFGEVVAGVDFWKDMAATLRNLVGGRSASYEDELVKARSAAMSELRERAGKLVSFFVAIGMIAALLVGFKGNKKDRDQE